MARAPVSKTGGWGFEFPPLLPGNSLKSLCLMFDEVFANPLLATLLLPIS